MILDDFAGIGGFERGLADLIDETGVGIEWDRDACATRAAAGLATIRADVARYPAIERIDARILAASPPCQAFSRAAGNIFERGGIKDSERLHAAGKAIGAGDLEERGVWADPRSALVLEPLRYAVARRPALVALEQVPDVAPLWETFAEVLERLGYSAWVGVLCAADYGLAQVRRRALLLATLDGTAAPAPPTHAEDGEDLFGAKPWPTMAEALGWASLDDVPLAAHHRPDRPDVVVDLEAEREAAAWVFRRPSTTIVAEYRPDIVAPPTHRPLGAPPRQYTPGAVRITLEDALALQGFPRDYPLAGSMSSKRRQVGNAVPPPLVTGALAGILKSLVRS